MKYLSECDLIIYDLHSGCPEDVTLALEALRKYKPEEGDEKVLIVISSLMAWQGTPKKQAEAQTAAELEAERKKAGDGGEGGEDGEDAPEDPPPRDDPSESGKSGDEEREADNEDDLLAKEERGLLEE
jgi:hypothetical protein